MKPYVVGDSPCPRCRSRGRDRTGNHLMRFNNGDQYCNRCELRIPAGKEYQPEDEDDDLPDKLSMEDINELPIFGRPTRQISVEACEFYGVRTEFDGVGEPCGWYYPHTSEGRITGYKRRGKNKTFTSIGNTKAGELFGQHVCKRGGSFVIITEGEDDTLAIWDTLRQRSDLRDWYPPVVSLSHGAASAVSDISRNLEWLEGFDRVILCFDNDEVGREAVDAVCPLLAGKVYICQLVEKDAVDMVLAGKADELKWDLLKHAKRYQPDGIVNVKDTWDRYKKSSTKECTPYPEDWKELNRMTYGFRLGEIVTITAGTSVGKSQFVRELILHTWKTKKDWRLAVISLEEDVGDTVSGLMSLLGDTRLHLPDRKVSEERERELWEELSADGRIELYDHFGGMDDNNLFNKLRYFAATGCKAVFLDHLSIIISEYAAEGGERERIDTVMTKLAKLAKELGIVIFIVVHLRKEGQGRSFEEGATPTLDDLRGSATLKQLSWDIISLSRNQQHYNPHCRNISKITVGKCRFSGRTGTADYLMFSEETGRMTAVAKPKDYEED